MLYFGYRSERKIDKIIKNALLYFGDLLQIKRNDEEYKSTYYKEVKKMLKDDDESSKLGKREVQLSGLYPSGGGDVRLSSSSSFLPSFLLPLLSL
jgi:hypothetical protein